MSERVITIHKTPHVSWQVTEAAAAATGLIGDAHEANVNRTENGLALKKNVDAPKSMCTLGATLTQTSEVSKILREGTKTPHGAQRQIDLQNVPNPQASFEDTSHAYECGYLDGLAKGRGETGKPSAGDLISREAAEVYQREALFGAGCSVDQVEAGLYCLRALPSQQAQGVMLPDDISAALRVIGRAEWGAVPARPDAEHVANFAKTLRITREHFSTEGPQELHGVYVAGSDVVICHTGTSPNSGVHARAIVGAWNWLLDTASAQQEGA